MSGGRPVEKRRVRWVAWRGMSIRALPEMTAEEAERAIAAIERSLEYVRAHPNAHDSRGTLQLVQRAYAKVFKKISGNKHIKMLQLAEEIAEDKQAGRRTRLRAIQLWDDMKERVVGRLAPDGAHVAPAEVPAGQQFNAQVNVVHSSPALDVDRHLAAIREKVAGNGG